MDHTCVDVQVTSEKTAVSKTFPVAAPVDTSRRIALLDILRGFALLGILLLNIDDFAGPESAALHDIPIGLAHPAFVGWHAALDYVIFAVKWTFFEGKMRALFGMLFGASTVLLLDRLEKRIGEGRAADIFHRRNMWLVAFGVIHGLFIWSGDILTQYGVFALMLLYPLRHVPARKLLIAGAAIWLIGGSIGATFFLDIPATVARDKALIDARAAVVSGATIDATSKAAIAAADSEMAQAPAQMEKALANGRADYARTLASNREGYLGFFGGVVTSGLMLEVIGAIITGMGLYKIGFLTGNLTTRTYATVALACYTIALPLSLGGLYYAAQHDLSVASVLQSMFYPYTVLQFVAAFGNASLIILMVRHRWMATVTDALAAVGRMAVTNYLLTSLLCRFVFTWGPWKLYGGLEYYQYLYVVAIVWVLNLVLSRLWLHFFAFGPVEWIWRSLTYWKRQPFVRTTNEAASRF